MMSAMIESHIDDLQAVTSLRLQRSTTGIEDCSMCACLELRDRGDAEEVLHDTFLLRGTNVVRSGSSVRQRYRGC